MGQVARDGLYFLFIHMVQKSLTTNIRMPVLGNLPNLLCHQLNENANCGGKTRVDGAARESIQMFKRVQCCIIATEIKQDYF